MNFVLQPWQLFSIIRAGWIHQLQQLALVYRRTENPILREKLGKRRLLLDDDQRRRLAVKGKSLGRNLLAQVGTLFTPDTILRWHWLLIAQKWDYSHRRPSTPGGPPVAAEISRLVARFARENPAWGYDPIQGALANLGHPISDTTVRNILKDLGLEPAPQRQRQKTWTTFLMAHGDVLAAIDFTTIDVWSAKGLVT